MSAGADPREQARDILAERRFQEPDLPRPFERPLEWLEKRLDALWDRLTAAFARADASLPGPSAVVWVLLAAVVAVAAALLARRLIRGRQAGAAGGSRSAPGGRPADPAALERAAAEAEARGDYEAAVRLRFRAGVARLAARRALEPGLLLTTGGLRCALRSPAFDALGSDFDAIAYGGRPAGPDDARAAREGWARVLEAAR